MTHEPQEYHNGDRRSTACKTASRLSPRAKDLRNSRISLDDAKQCP